MFLVHFVMSPDPIARLYRSTGSVAIATETNGHSPIMTPAPTYLLVLAIKLWPTANRKNTDYADKSSLL